MLSKLILRLFQCNEVMSIAKVSFRNEVHIIRVGEFFTLHLFIEIQPDTFSGVDLHVRMTCLEDGLSRVLDI